MSRSRPWIKFFTLDWRNDLKLRLCTLSARGLWVEIIAILHDESKPYGFLILNGRPVSVDELALLVGRPFDEVHKAFAELLDRGVVAVSEAPETAEYDVPTGTYFSRRMVRDSERLAGIERDETGRFSPGMGPDTAPDTDPGAVPETDIRTDKKRGTGPSSLLDSILLDIKKREKAGNEGIFWISRTLVFDRDNRKVVSKKATQSPVEVPLVLAESDAWVAKFYEWSRYRTEDKRKSITYAALRKQVASMERAGPGSSVLAIDRAIESDWVGVFPEKESDRPRSRSTSIQPKSTEKRKAKLRNVGEKV